MRLFRYSSRLCLTGLVVSSFATSVLAVPLAPGEANDSIGTGGLVSGSLVHSITESFSSTYISGQLISSVWSGDRSNPYGGLTFAYQLIMDPVSEHSLAKLSLNDFGGFMVDVTTASASPGAPGTPPYAASRSLEGAGDVVGFYFPFGIGLAPGESSSLMVVRTDGQGWQPTIASVINGSVASMASLAPTAVPDGGATFALLALGASGLVIVRRKL